MMRVQQCVAAILAAAAAGLGHGEDAWTYRVQVDFGPDRGQNIGTLFEVRDEEGHAIAGAGFLGAYNTYFPADRHTLHAFVLPPGADTPATSRRVSYPSPSPHHYLFDIGDAVYATDRGAPPSMVRWNPDAASWEAPEEPVALSFPIGNARLALATNHAALDGREVFSFDRSIGTTGLYYFGLGTLFFHLAAANSPERQTYLYACPWEPDSGEAVPVAEAIILPLTAPGEFPYSYGQIDGAVIVGTNNGGVYRFREGKWTTLRAADPTVSFQLYTMITYHDRLLMGQYPTGEIFEIVGDAVVHLEGWPPRPEGASARAREAQALTLYRGELFAGIWPWGEVWRLPAPNAAWEFHGRLFTHPEMVPAVTAPYEAELTALEVPVNNLWGQRVTSLIPMGDMLLASTANKNGAPMEPRLEFLAEDERWREYGAVHHLHLPGHLSASMRWTGQLSEFLLEITPAAMRVYQDGVLLGETPLEAAAMAGFQPDSVRVGAGVFGRFSGASIEMLAQPEE